MSHHRAIRTRKIRSFGLSLAVACVLSLQSSLALAVDLDRVVAFDIAPQNLSTALIAFGRQTGVQVLTASDTLVEAKQVQGLKGAISLRAALQQLLHGSGLQYREVGENSISITPASDPARGDEDAAATTTGNAVNLNRIMVTGTRLRDVGEAGRPVMVFDESDIRRTGATSLQTFIDQLPQASTNVAENDYREGSASTINLRGLSSGATAVLINGRRIATSGHLSFSGGFDLNHIPITVIDRLEILTAGASAIYGADAMAGVVNIILKRSEDALAVELRGGSTSDGAQDDHRFSVYSGIEKGGFSGMVAFDYFERSNLDGADRERTADRDYRRFGGPDRRSSQTHPGNVCAVSGLLPGVGTSCAGIPDVPVGTALTPESFLPTAGVLNRESDRIGADIIPATRRDSFFASGRYDFDAG